MLGRRKKCREKEIMIDKESRGTTNTKKIGTTTVQARGIIINTTTITNREENIKTLHHLHTNSTLSCLMI